MKAIFLDTTKNMTIGVLNDNYTWLRFQFFSETKSTEGLHLQLVNILDELNLSLKDIGILFTAAGPGSYTGMRVSEGFAQIFKWQGIRTNSFYHFDVPQIMGIKNYVFICKAFKGEFFLKDSKTEGLYNLSDLETVLSKYSDMTIFSHHSEDGLPNFSSTMDLIKERPEVIFPKVFEENLMVGPFYFRPLEKEFKVTDA